MNNKVNLGDGKMSYFIVDLLVGKDVVGPFAGREAAAEAFKAEVAKHPKAFVGIEARMRA